MLAKFAKYIISVLAIVFSFGSIALLVYLLNRPEFNDHTRLINPALAADFGSLASGLVVPLTSLASIFLLVLTLWAQFDIFRKQSFENRFFQMLTIHRRNVSEISYRKSEDVTKNRRGRTVFEEINYQIETAKTALSKGLSSKLTEDEIVNIAYLTVFFGPEQLLNSCSFYIQSYVEVKGELVTILKEIRSLKTQDKKFRAFTGHQIRLGHYFRHLYQSVTYIDDQKFLSDLEKMRYVKMLRSQLSTTELITFFFNSLSTLGAPWERGQSDKNKKLISKYRLIKNLPYENIFEIKPKEKYPEIVFEYEESLIADEARKINSAKPQAAVR